MAPDNCIKVKRDGPRGWHWIAAASFDPAAHELFGAVAVPAIPKTAPKRKATR